MAGDSVMIKPIRMIMAYNSNDTRANEPEKGEEEMERVEFLET